jgi:hypothetical protein
MAQQQEVLNVKIKKDSTQNKNNPPFFAAKQNSVVTFEFDGGGNVTITFDGDSPFADSPLGIGKHTVKSDAKVKKYTFSWSDGRGGIGNGSGEVLPGR